MRVSTKELVLGRYYNIRHYGQVWLRVRYMGQVDFQDRLAHFRTTSGIGPQFEQSLYFDMQSTRWTAYITEGM